MKITFPLVTLTIFAAAGYTVATMSGLLPGGRAMTLDEFAQSRTAQLRAATGLPLPDIRLPAVGLGDIPFPRLPGLAVRGDALPAQSPPTDVPALTGAEAQLADGLRYLKGDGVPADAARAEELIAAAAQSGLAEAQYQHALLLADIAARDPNRAPEALAALQAAAAQGHAAAQSALGQAYLKGQGAPRDNALARQWLEKAVAQGDGAARGTLALLYLDPKDSAPLTPAQVETIDRALAADPDPSLAYAYATALRDGKRLSQDMARALVWYEVAAEGGNTNAWAYLGRIYASGDAALRDTAKAQVWLRKVAELDLGYGYYDYAALLYQIDPAANREEILKWAEKSRRENGARAEELLKKMQAIPAGEADTAAAQSEGEGASVPAAQSASAPAAESAAAPAVLDFKAATLAALNPAADAPLAEAGDAEAQFRLSYALLNGKGIKRDRVKAVEWLGKAAEGGSAPAQYQLGQMAEKGLAVPRDNARAIDLYRKAAAQDFAPAQFALGRALYEGRLAVKNEEEGLEWIEKARAQNEKQALAYRRDRRKKPETPEVKDEAGAGDDAGTGAPEMLEP